jgi:hypothetical protein
MRCSPDSFVINIAIVMQCVKLRLYDILAEPKEQRNKGTKEQRNKGTKEQRNKISDEWQ